MTAERHLYTMTGVVTDASNGFEILSGIVLAASEDEARGNHVAFMQRQKPGWLVHSCAVIRVPDALVREAAQGLAIAR